MSRVKGQEVDLSFTDPDGDVSFSEILNFEAELDIELLEEHYLGQTAAEYDEIFNGVTGKIELHMRDASWIQFTEKVQDRAQRRTAASGKFTVTSSFRFPNGQRVRITFEDIHFGRMPLVTGARKEYVRATIEWAGSTIRRVL